MQITSMLSAGYLEPMQETSRVRSPTDTKEVDQSKQAKEQEILAEEQSLKAKLGNSAQVHTVYHYSMGTDGRRYITGASVTMKGSEEDLNRVSGGVTTEDLQTKKQESNDTHDITRPDAERREPSRENDKPDNEKEAQIRELENIQREVVAHEAAHKAAAGEFGGGISYTYTEGPDGKKYITGGEVPIKLKQGNTPEETLRNMQQVQNAANAPADPSGQDRQVAAKAAAIAAKARSEVTSDTSEQRVSTVVAHGTPIIETISRDNEHQDPGKTGVLSVLASLKELQLQNLVMAA